MRVLIGSTEKMGAGTNFQHHLVALHHVDCPWRPRDIEQREGRILRAGNMNPEVEIFTYVTEGSYDANMWDKVRYKQQMIDAVMSGDSDIDEMEDVNSAAAMDYNDIAAIAEDNPFIKKRMEADNKVKKLKLLASQYNTNRREMSYELSKLPTDIAANTKLAQDISADIKNRVDTKGDAFSMKLGGKTYTKRADAQTALEAVDKAYDSDASQKIGEIGGFDIHMRKSRSGYAIWGSSGTEARSGNTITLVGHSSYTTGENTVSSMEATLRGLEKRLKKVNYSIDADKKRKASLEEELAKPFGKLEELNQAQKELDAIDKQIREADAKKENNPAENNQAEQPDKHYSISEAKERAARTSEDLKQEIMQAFPGARDIKDNGDHVSFTMPNGMQFEVSLHENMKVTGKAAVQARSDHGYASGVDIKVNGAADIVNGKAIIDLSKCGDIGTTHHEAMHIALRSVLSPKERQALFRRYDAGSERMTEEKIADAYRDYRIARATGGHVPFAKIFDKIRDFFEQLAAHLPIIGKKIATNYEARKAFENLASGKAWGYNEQSGAKRGFSLFNRAEAAGRQIDNRAGRGDNEDRYIDEFLKENLSEEDRTDIDSRVENLIRENIDDMRKGKKMPEEVRDGMALLKGLRSVYHNQGRLANSKVYGNKTIQELKKKIERLYAYARRRFDNDERIKGLIDEQNAFGNRREDVRRGGEAAVPGNAYANANRNGAGGNRTVSISTSGETSDLMQGFNRQLEDAMKGNVHHSISRSDNQDGFSSADKRYSISTEEQKTRNAEQSFLTKASENLAKAMHLKSDKVITEARNGVNDNFNILDATVKSPYLLAAKNPIFRMFFNMANRAMNEEIKNRNDFRRKMDAALKPLKGKDRDDLWQIMLSGDAEGKEYNRDELLADGVSEKTADAYKAIRRLLNKAYHLANNARRNPVDKSAHLSNAEIQELRDNQFVKEILSVGPMDKSGKHLVSWREYRNYTHQYENLNAEQLASLQKNDGVQILATDEVGKGADGKLYNVLVREGPADIHKLKGYVPHFFHDFFVRVVDKDGNSEVIGSGRTETEAIKIGEQYAKNHPLEAGQTIHVSPKIFDIGSMSSGDSAVSEATYGAILGDMDYYKVQEAVAKNNDLTLDEAKRLMDKSIRMKNRHRFFGNAMHRKGVKGFETDMEWALGHYFNTVSRYAAMESEFKPKAISLFERMFGDFSKDHTGLAKYVKDYINDINGNPSAFEQILNKALQSTALFRKVITPVFGERAALTMGNGIANKISYLTLGLNMSSALLNFTQLMNSAAYLGDPRLLATMVAKGRHHKYTRRELRILAETGVLNDIGLDSGSGYDQARKHVRRSSSLLGKANATIDAAGNMSMMFFREADAICRRGTVLAAYELARHGKAPGHKGEHMTHDAAIAYAKEVNRKANFDYGVADAANIFRRGSIFSQLALQFKKYGFKELEVMADFFPTSSRTTRAQKVMFWGMYFMLAGMMGIPALDWFDDEMGGLKDGIQSFIIKHVGNKYAAEAIMYGMPALLGMNLSSRAGLSDVIPTEGIDFTGPLASKLYQLKRDGTRWAFQGGDWATVLRDVSPGLYNLVAATRGETYDRRGRVNDRYTTTRDRIMRAVGFKSTDESVSTDVQRIVRDQKSKRTEEEQGAIDAAIKDPSSKNLAKLKELGIDPKRFKAEKEKKGTTKNDRTAKSVPKKQKQDYDYLLNFAKE